MNFNRTTVGRGRGRRGAISGSYVRRDSLDGTTSESSASDSPPQQQRRQRRVPRRSRHEEWRELKRLYENVETKMNDLKRCIDATSPDSEEMEWNQHPGVVYCNIPCHNCGFMSGRPEISTSPGHDQATPSSTLQGEIDIPNNFQARQVQPPPQANPFNTTQHQTQEITQPRNDGNVGPQHGQVQRQQQPAHQSGQNVLSFDPARSAAAATGGYSSSHLTSAAQDRSGFVLRDPNLFGDAGDQRGPCIPFPTNPKWGEWREPRAEESGPLSM